MINIVLQRLELLRAELAALDPAHEIAAADQVAAMARALREVSSMASHGRHRAVAARRITPRRAAG